jgi:hypothetical protein
MELKAGKALLGQSEEPDCSIRLNFGQIDRDEPVFASMERRIAAWVEPPGGSVRWAKRRRTLILRLVRS